MYDPGTNRSGVNNATWDVAWRQQSIGGYGFTYDAENRMASATLNIRTVYQYDGDGRGVAKITCPGTARCDATTAASTVWYVYDAAGNLAVEYGQSSMASALPCTTCYLMPDHLGSTRVMTDQNGNAVSGGCHDYLPFGEEIYSPVGQRSTSCYPTSFKPGMLFTGKLRDGWGESQLDYFGARYYSSLHMRFTTPDPVKITPDRLRDPQQLNLYSYARNNPLRYIDPSGEILQLSGDINEAQKQLCQWLGTDDCAQRISYNQKTNTITVDLNGIDIGKNEGASLLSQLVNSDKVYDLVLGNNYPSAAGMQALGNEAIVNNSNTFDPPRFPYDKPANVRPPSGIASVVAIDPANAKFRDSQGRAVPLSMVMFHELAEAYSKVDLGKPYNDFELGYIQNGMIVTAPVGFQRGAHNDAVQREIMLRNQRPNLRLSGRAGDVLIRDPR